MRYHYKGSGGVLRGESREKTSNSEEGFSAVCGDGGGIREVHVSFATGGRRGSMVYQWEQ